MVQYEVILEINRPGFGTQLSDAAQGMLEPGQQSRWW